MNKIIKNIENKKRKIIKYLTRISNDFEHFNRLLTDENIDQYFVKDKYSKI